MCPFKRNKVISFGTSIAMFSLRPLLQRGVLFCHEHSELLTFGSYKMNRSLQRKVLSPTKNMFWPFSLHKPFFSFQHKHSVMLTSGTIAARCFIEVYSTFGSYNIEQISPQTSATPIQSIQFGFSLFKCSLSTQAIFSLLARV